MKFAYIIIILVSIWGIAISQETTNPNQGILGDWKLEVVDIGNKTLYPKVNFFLNISETKVSYNKDINRCFTKATITSSRITMEGVACTEVCCDGRLDTIGSFLNYSGYYQISNDTLMISNENKYLLIKQ